MEGELGDSEEGEPTSVNYVGEDAEFGEVLVELLVRLYDRVIKTGTTPKQWKLVEIRLLRKKCEKDQIDNFRPRSSTSSMGKLSMKIIKERAGR